MGKYIHQSKKNYITGCTLPLSAEPGAVRFDSGSQTLKVYDGYTWNDFDTEQNDLTVEAQTAIDNMIELTENLSLGELSNKYPVLEEAVKQLKFALRLCQKNES